MGSDEKKTRREVRKRGTKQKDGRREETRNVRPFCFTLSPHCRKLYLKSQNGKPFSFLPPSTLPILSVCSLNTSSFFPSIKFFPSSLAHDMILFLRRLVCFDFSHPYRHPHGPHMARPCRDTSRRFLLLIHFLFT